MKPYSLKDLIDEAMKSAPRTIGEVLQEQRTEKLSTSTKKRRKTDRRTLRKQERARRMEEWRNPDSARYRYESGLKSDFHKLRREVKRRREKTARPDSPANWEWDIKLHEWLEMWGKCPKVDIGFNVYRPAWKCRGRKKGCVQLKRIDTLKPWCLGNLMITQGKKVLYETSPN